MLAISSKKYHGTNISVKIFENQMGLNIDDIFSLVSDSLELRPGASFS